VSARRPSRHPLHSKPAVTASQRACPTQVSAAATSLNKLWWRGKPSSSASEDGGAAAYAAGPSATAPSPGAASTGRSEAPLPV